MGKPPRKKTVSPQKRPAGKEVAPRKTRTVSRDFVMPIEAGVSASVGQMQAAGVVLNPVRSFTGNAEIAFRFRPDQEEERGHVVQGLNAILKSIEHVKPMVELLDEAQTWAVNEPKPGHNRQRRARSVKPLSDLVTQTAVAARSALEQVQSSQPSLLAGQTAVYLLRNAETQFRNIGKSQTLKRTVAEWKKQFPKRAVKSHLEGD